MNTFFAIITYCYHTIIELYESVSEWTTFYQNHNGEIIH